jgi:signal transduction histidine kinase
MRKALDHLLSNAIKFNREGGSVTVSLRRQGKDGPVEIAVADTGIGIAQEDLPRLFQPFVQLDASHARRYGGIGIGLALVKRLADACGSGIDVESEPGRGSVFTLRLPRTRHPGKTNAGKSDAEQMA